MKGEVDNKIDSMDCFKTDGPEERWDAVRQKYTLSAEAYSADNQSI